MKNNKLLLLLFVLIVILASCNKDKIDETDSPLEYRYILMDTLRNEKTEFNQGENIVFSFQIINKSSEDLMIRNFLGPWPFKVYQIKINEDTLDYGYPYDGSCEVGGFMIPKNDTTEFNCPWVYSENNNFYHFCLFVGDPTLHETYLPIGNFYTNFEPTIEIPDLKTETKYFEINFTVK